MRSTRLIPSSRRRDGHAPSYSTYDEAIHISIRGECHLRLGEAARAVSYRRQALDVLDHSCFTRDVTMAVIGLGEAYVLCTEIDEAARLLGDAGEIAAGNSSARLIGWLEQVRAGMEPWRDTRAVRELDERLVGVEFAASCRRPWHFVTPRTTKVSIPAAQTRITQTRITLAKAGARNPMRMR